MKLRLLAAAFCLVTFTLNLRAEDYAISFARPYPVGFKFHAEVKTKETQKMKLTSGDKTLKEQAKDIAISFVGDITVTGVTPKGKVKDAEFVVESLVQTTPEGAQTLLKDKQVVVMQSNPTGQRQFSLKGGDALDPNVQMAMGKVLEKPTDGEDDDEVFGTKDRKKIGDSWPVNVEVLLKNLASKGLRAKPEDTTAKVTLADVKEVNGMKSENLQAQITMKNLEGGKLPPGSSMEQSIMEVRMDGWFPIDQPLPNLRNKLGMTMKMVMKIPNPETNELATMDNAMEMSRETNFTPLK